MNKIAKTVAPDKEVSETVSQIAKDNGIENVNLIYVGEALSLPTATSTTVAQTTTDTTNSNTQSYTAPAETQAQADTTTETQTAIQSTQETTTAPTSATSSTGTSDALAALIARESSGNVNATNGDYFGIGQLSSQARATYGGNSTDYNDQLNAMKGYITARYGTAENALAHSNATGWY